MVQGLFDLETMQSFDGALSIFSIYESLSEEQRQQAIDNADLNILGGFVTSAIVFNKVAPDVFNVYTLSDMAKRYLLRVANEQ